MLLLQSEELPVSQPSRQRKGRTAPPQSPLPAIISALVVIAVFVALGFALASNRPGAATQSTGATAGPSAALPPAPGAAPPTGAAAAPPATAAAAPPAAQKTYSAPPPMTIDPKKTYTATFTTPRGDFVVKLRPDLA